MSVLLPTPRHNDMFGEIRSAISGGTQWTEAQINDTSFIVGWLANNSTDFFQLTIQCPHTRRMGSNLDSIHLHFILESAATSGQTIVWTPSYTWLRVGDSVPANAAWTSLGTVTQTLATTAAFYYGLFNFGTNIAPPASETYGGMILFKVTRGNGTHTGRIGVLDCDAHTLMDRFGSVNETSDS